MDGARLNEQFKKECMHTHGTYTRDGDTWTDTATGKPHTIIYTKCKRCDRTIAVNQTDSAPMYRMPPPVQPMGGPKP